MILVLKRRTISSFVGRFANEYTLKYMIESACTFVASEALFTYILVIAVSLFSIYPTRVLFMCNQAFLLLQLFKYLHSCIYSRINMEMHSLRSVNSMSTQCQLQRNQIVYILNTVCWTFQLPVALICSHKEARHHERS